MKIYYFNNQLIYFHFSGVQLDDFEKRKFTDYFYVKWSQFLFGLT